MSDTTNWTPAPEDNKLGLLDKETLNIYEAKGIAKAELHVFGLDIDVNVTAQLICEIHRIAFSELYDWAGKWRTVNVLVGDLLPPEPHQVAHLMYQYADNLNSKIASSSTSDEHLECLVYSHYEFIRIHPFINGNGRTGRIIMNITAMKFGYRPLELYHRAGDSIKIYIEAMKSADKGNIQPLTALIGKELSAF